MQQPPSDALNRPLPRQRPWSGFRRGPDAKRLVRALNDLPLADVGRCAQTVARLNADLNAVRISAARRLACQQGLSAVARELVATALAGNAQSWRLLSPSSVALFDAVETMLDCEIQGWRVLVGARQNRAAAGWTGESLLACGDLLRLRAANYGPGPEGFWVVVAEIISALRDGDASALCVLIELASIGLPRFRPAEQIQLAELFMRLSSTFALGRSLADVEAIIHGLIEHGRRDFGGTGPLVGVVDPEPLRNWAYQQLQRQEQHPMPGAILPVTVRTILRRIEGTTARVFPRSQAAQVVRVIFGLDAISATLRGGRHGTMATSNGSVANWNMTEVSAGGFRLVSPTAAGSMRVGDLVAVEESYDMVAIGAIRWMANLGNGWALGVQLIANAATGAMLIVDDQRHGALLIAPRGSRSEPESLLLPVAGVADDGLCDLQVGGDLRTIELGNVLEDGQGFLRRRIRNVA